MRLITFSLLAILIALAFETFLVKHETRQTKTELAKIELAIEETRSSLRFQKAEWSLINRPKFLENRTAALGFATPPAERIMAMSEVVRGLHALELNVDAATTNVASAGQNASDFEIAQTAR